MDSKKLNEIQAKYIEEENFISENLRDADLDQQLIEHMQLENKITFEKGRYTKLSAKVLKMVKARKDQLMEEKDTRLPGREEK
ncbi:MAG: hypothetical protein HRU19_04725 [Pseudobacteriovorax sp.]|nr:hypothetical protein [Pseudobacteriovorax sp.]